jgi:hypothetical protein
LELLTELESFDDFLDHSALSFAVIPPCFVPVRNLLLSFISLQEGHMKLRQMAAFLILRLCRLSQSFVSHFSDLPSLSLFITLIDLVIPAFPFIFMDILSALLEESGEERRNLVLEALPVEKICTFYFMSTATLDKVAACSLLSAYCRFPFDGYEQVVPVVADSLSELYDESRVIILQLLLNMVEWSRLDFFPSLLTLMPQILEGRGSESILACGLVGRSCCRHGDSLGVDFAQLFELAFRNADSSTEAAIVVAQICQNREIYSTKILETDMLLVLMGQIDSLPTEIKFHMCRVLLSVAEASEGAWIDKLLHPPGIPTSFFQCVAIALGFEQQELVWQLIHALDHLFTILISDPEALMAVTTEFLRELPGDSIWDDFSFADPELDELADQFVRKWFEVAEVDPE